MRLLSYAPYPLIFRVEIATIEFVRYYQFDYLDDQPRLQIVKLFLSTRTRIMKSFLYFHRKLCLPSGLIAFTGLSPLGFCCFFICVTFSSDVFSKSGSPRIATILHFRNNSKCVQNVSPGSTGTFSWNSVMKLCELLGWTIYAILPSRVRSHSFLPTIHQSCSLIFV